MTIVDFDSLLNLEGTINTEFIPQYVWLNTKCNFLTEERVLSIAKDIFKVKDKIIHTDFDYSFPQKRYLWTITNNITNNDNGEGEKEVALIDALNGKVIHYEKGLQIIVK